MVKKFCIMLFLFFILLSAFSISLAHAKNIVCLKNYCFNVDIVQKRKDMLQGLKSRKSLKDDAGMLFVFPKSGRYGFWMKDMNISLDIIWLDRHGKVVFIAHDVPPCHRMFCPVYKPIANALYVLEINAGLASRLGVNIGDIARIGIDLEGNNIN